MINGKPVIFAQETPQYATSGCNHYRINQPMKKIIEKDLLPCGLSSEMSFEEQEMWTDKADIYVTQMAKSRKLLDYMLFCKKNNLGKKFVIDSDDNLFYVSPFNPAYYLYGIDEVSFNLEDGRTLEIKDNENGFEIERNKEILTALGLCLKNCDMITTPSPVLSGFYKRFNKNVKTLKNYVNLDVFKPITLMKDEYVRILWQGSASHYEDWCEIQETMEILLNKYDKLKLIVFGQIFDGCLRNIPKEKIEKEKFVVVSGYPYKLRTINADIGIAPLKNNIFNTCKSELKWEEYSALEIPCVASNIPPYSLNINDGKDGFLCSNAKEWIDTLSILVENVELRKRIGKQARERIEKDYDIDKNIQKYVDAYESLFHKELILV